MNHVFRAREGDSSVKRTAMLDYIPQGFLDNSKEAKRHFLWQQALAPLFLKCDLNLVVRSKFAAEAFHCGNQTQMIQLGRMKLIRHPVDLRRNLLSSGPNILDGLANVVSIRWNSLRQLFQLD